MVDTACYPIPVWSLIAGISLILPPPTRPKGLQSKSAKGGTCILVRGRDRKQESEGDRPGGRASEKGIGKERERE